jgi:hypothetical protein
MSEKGAVEVMGREGVGWKDVPERTTPKRVAEGESSPIKNPKSTFINHQSSIHAFRVAERVAGS